MSSQSKKYDVQAASITEPDADVVHQIKRAYESPELMHYGDVRDVTLGPTVGIGESGNELARRNPT